VSGLGKLGWPPTRRRLLPIPVIGRIEAGNVVLDLRCLEDEAAFLAQLAGLSAAAK